jgi:exonuclease VII small subunit
MSHDQFKAAVRQRMAETGEPYTVARREHLRQQADGASQPDNAAMNDPAGLAQVRADIERAAREMAAGPAALEQAMASAMQKVADPASLEQVMADAGSVAAEMAAGPAALEQVMADLERAAAAMAEGPAAVEQAMADAERAASQVIESADLGKVMAEIHWPDRSTPGT